MRTECPSNNFVRYMVGTIRREDRQPSPQQLHVFMVYLEQVGEGIWSPPRSHCTVFMVYLAGTNQREDTETYPRPIHS
jgi:hypothetical protein